MIEKLENVRIPDTDKFLRATAFESGPCEHVAETVLSKLYFFPNVVRKWYKRETAYYGDLANDEVRREFYAEDFAWNNAVSPQVYSKLRGITYGPNGTFNWAPPEDAQDFVIEMTRLKNAVTMSDRLLTGQVATRDLRECMHLLLQASAHLKERGHAPTSGLQTSLMMLYEQILADLRLQLHRAAAFLPIEEADDAITRLSHFVEQSSYFNTFPAHDLGVAIDCHTDNIIVLESGESVLIDSMFPKRSWRVLDDLHTIARLAANVAVLGDASKRDDVYTLYEKPIDDSHRAASLIHETRTALMQWSRRHLLGQPELAEKFRRYAHERLEELETYRGT